MKFLVALLMCIVFVSAQDKAIALTGSVSSESLPLEGVIVYLANNSDIKDTTEADGKFDLSNGISAVRTTFESPNEQFSIVGGNIVFPKNTASTKMAVTLFRADGKRVFSRIIPDLRSLGMSLVLPELGAGIYMLQVAIDEKKITQQLFSVNSSYLVAGAEVPAGTSEKSRLGKGLSSAVAVDTIVAEKEGFKTSKVPVSSYLKDAIKITLEVESSTGGECTRESMKAIVDKYIEAQEAGDPSMMPLAADVKIFENTEEKSLEESFLSKVLKIDFHLSIFDVDSCRTFTEVIVGNSTPQYVIGTRLRIKDDKITEVSLIVTDKDEWGFNADNFLKYAKQQDWYVLSESERSSREELIDAGNQYLDIFNADDEDVPWGAPCYRIEGGMVTFQGDETKDYCTVLSKDVLGYSGGDGFLIGDRDFIVDEELGAVDVFCAFCVLDSHLFRLVDGHYRYVHTLTIGCN